VNVAEPLDSALEAVVLSTVSDTFPVTVPAPEVTPTVTLPFALYVIVAAEVIAVVVEAWLTVCVTLPLLAR
jgi:hypothetical protein